MSGNRFIQIDEEGYFHFSGQRIVDETEGRRLLTALKYDEHGRLFTAFEDKEALVEAFDEPIIAQQIDKRNHEWVIIAHYGFVAGFDCKALTLDEWDRFHGFTADGIPFVMSRKAQNEFFNLLDEFSDDSIIVDGEEIQIDDWLQDNPEAEPAQFWCERYRRRETPWDGSMAHPALQEILPQLKLPKSRIVVPGCGAGHDAAYLAEQGHVVTGIDISKAAIELAQKNYGHIRNLEFVSSDIFSLPKELHHQFDLVFEHTCYCAIPPSRRNELVKIWRKLLSEQGQLLALFFVYTRISGPPYGGSEYEVKRRLEKNFRLDYWTRWRHSIERRLGKELVVFGQKKGPL